MRNRIFLFFSIAIALAGCTDPKHTGRENRILEELEKVKLEFIDYPTVNRFVFQPFCVSCHQQKNKEPIYTYKHVKKNQAAIRHSVFVVSEGKKKMPPVEYPMPQKAYEILQLWLDADAPEQPVPISEIDNPKEPVPDPGIENVNFKVVTQTVLDVACNRCHKPDNQYGAVDFTNIENVRSTINTIMGFVLFSSTMPPREDPPVPLPKDWLDNETVREDPNPNLISNEQKIILYKWFLNNMAE